MTEARRAAETLGDDTRPPRYRLFIDESGDHATRRLDLQAHRYLALLGVWFSLEPDYREFSSALDYFKKEIFSRYVRFPVVLHRTDIINRRGAFSMLADQRVRMRFNAGLLAIIGRAAFKVVCVLIDKLEHKNRYCVPAHPYHYCLAEMIRPYAAWLDKRGATGDVVAESRGGVEDMSLKSAYQQVQGTGELIYDRQRNQRVLTSKELKIRPKGANVAGLQLADLIAHPIKQWVLAGRGLIEPPADAFGSELVAAVQAKLNQDEQTGRVVGHGVIWLPK